ncbi:photosynthetic reaction center cytochrome PufC [Halomonas denitrificans]|nr:photosynthetic reaction center cytochrome c subunit [Halomonas denitrificans]
MKIVAWFVGLIALFLTGFMLFTAGWERPPVESEQSGYRGTGMAQIINPRADPQRLEAQLADVPEATPMASGAGPRAGDVYQNVQVLDDLSVAQFTRVMQAITQWIYPEEGCAGCHNLNNLADESMYQKGVSRRMLQMTRHINGEWGSHVGNVGVTCYTCHRGNAVPQYTWFNADPAIHDGAGMVGWRNGQNLPADAGGLSSLPEDPFSALLEQSGQIRVAGDTALPDGDDAASIQATEWTYSLMMHMSNALDVNCTYCHNSRAFSAWEESSPQRQTAWHGIRMAQNVNAEYVASVSGMLPEDRLGPTGEGRKVNCETCHQGVNKPLGGLAMAENYPSLWGDGGAPQMSLEDVAAAHEALVIAAEAEASNEPVEAGEAPPAEL